MPEPRIAHDTPEPPYYAVIFASRRVPGLAGDEARYAPMADRMEELASRQPGYLGIESARGPDGFGITVSYWKDLASIAAWKANAEHRIAQALGKERFYAEFSLRVAKVERMSWRGASRPG